MYEPTFETILEQMEYERIFKVWTDDNKFIISEECDSHFAQSLTKAEAQQLINELQQIVNTLKEN